MRRFRNITIILCALQLVGCRTALEKQCDGLIRSINWLAQRHLKSGLKFDAKVFESAELELLHLHGLPSPKSRSSSSIEQCSYVVSAVRDRSPRKPSAQDALVELLDLYVQTWDPHSRALTENQIVAQTTFFNGYGFELKKTQGSPQAEIVDVIAGSPAHNAGLKEGLSILSVNNEMVRDKTLDQISRLINGDALRESVTLGIVTSIASKQSDARRAIVRTVILKRAQFEVAPVKFRVLQGGALAYVKLRTFTGAEAIFTEVLQTVSSASALILDLRDLSGGSVQAAADLADWLTSRRGSFVGFLGRDGSQSEPLKLRADGSIWDGPLVVLVNAETKSAAELLAGALQDYGAVVVGSRTYGKGTRQLYYSVASFGIKGGVFLTDAYTIRPSGKVVQYQGVSPDVALPPPPQGDVAREEQLAVSLKPPKDSAFLPGYEPRPALPNLKDLEQRLQLLIETGTLGQSDEDCEVEAAKRVATFLIQQAEGENVDQTTFDF